MSDINISDILDEPTMSRFRTCSKRNHLYSGDQGWVGVECLISYQNFFGGNFNYLKKDEPKNGIPVIFRDGNFYWKREIPENLQPEKMIAEKVFRRKRFRNYRRPTEIFPRKFRRKIFQSFRLLGKKFPSRAFGGNLNLNLIILNSML